MAQIKRPPRFRSPPARQIPSLPDPIRFRPPQNTLSKKKQYDPVIAPDKSEQSLFNLTSSSNQFSTLDRQKPTSARTNIIKASLSLPQLNDDKEVPEKKHLPVYAQFPFDMSRLPQPMEINIEDNIHQLRLRLIDSELNHQRRSMDEYIKRTHRIGMDNDLPDNSNIERDLEIRRIQEPLSNRGRSNEQLITPSYSYNPHLQLEPLDEENLYTTSNLDDLIDSVARRHLASRRLNTAFDGQRPSNGYHGSFIGSLNTGRISHRNQDLLYTNRLSRNHTERDLVRINPNRFNQMLRSRIDYYNRIQPDLDDANNDDLIHTNSYDKLPPISSRQDSKHFQNPSTSTLFDTKTRFHVHQPSANQSEHFIGLSSDLFSSSQTKTTSSSQRSRTTRPRSLSKDTRSATDRSDGENEVPLTNRRKKHSQNDYDGFFTESTNRLKKKTKFRGNLFKKAAIGIFFLITLKHRAIRNHSHRSKQSASATIHKIRLQEIIVALHRVYLEPDGPIYNTLIQAISNPISLENALNPSSKNYSEAIHIIGDVLKNIISKMTEFMPKDGVLGTEKTSAISALIQDGNPFPENYFWECERELLEFDQSKVIHITKQRAILLLIGLFLFRALVTTLLIKPIKYRLILGQLKPNQSVSLKILASVMLYIGRRVAAPKPRMLAMPHEWQLSLYTDTDIEGIVQQLEIKSIIDTCEQSLRMWCEEYIRRIDQNFDKQLRT